MQTHPKNLFSFFRLGFSAAKPALATCAILAAASFAFAGICDQKLTIHVNDSKAYPKTASTTEIASPRTGLHARFDDSRFQILNQYGIYHGVNEASGTCTGSIPDSFSLEDVNLRTGISKSAGGCYSPVSQRVLAERAQLLPNALGELSKKFPQFNFNDYLLSPYDHVLVAVYKTSSQIGLFDFAQLKWLRQIDGVSNWTKYWITFEPSGNYVSVDWAEHDRTVGNIYSLFRPQQPVPDHSGYFEKGYHSNMIVGGRYMVHIDNLSDKFPANVLQVTYRDLEHEGVSCGTEQVTLPRSFSYRFDGRYFEPQVQEGASSILFGWPDFNEIPYNPALKFLGSYGSAELGIE